MTSLPFRVDRVGRLWVVRDDLVEGGTKARAVPAMFDSRREYVYAGPPEGYAQIALAAACRSHGKLATVFVAARAQRHAFTQRAATHGAQIVEVRPGYLGVVRARAREYAAKSGAVMLPFGFDCPEFRMALRQAILSGMAHQPREVWSVAGSGTLTRVLQRVWPAARFHAVRVGAEPEVGVARLWQAPEPFSKPAAILPPFPSCASYDAKAWRFVQQHASDDALFWNVAS